MKSKCEMKAKSCHASNFDGNRKITHRNQRSDYFGPETSNLGNRNDDRMIKTENQGSYKRNTALNISQNEDNTRIRKRSGSFQLQTYRYNNDHRSHQAFPKYFPAKTLKTPHTPLLQIQDLPHKNAKAHYHNGKADYSVTEDWDEECLSLKSKETVGLPGSSPSSLNIKQNKCTLDPTHAALVSAYQDLIQTSSEHSSKKNQLGANQELILKSDFQTKDLEGKKELITRQSSKDSSNKITETQVHLNSNSLPSSQDLDLDINDNAHSLTESKPLNNSSICCDKDKLSEDDHNDAFNKSKLSVAHVSSDPTEVCTYDACSEVSSDLEAEICSQSDEGEIMNQLEIGDIKGNGKRKKHIKHPNHCHPSMPENPGSTSCFPIESLSLPASSFGSKESIEKVIHFMQSCSVKMQEFISNCQLPAPNALITISVPDSTHNNTTCCSVHKLHPHCCHEVFKHKVDDSNLVPHLFPFPSMPYLMPPYWQWNYWPEWHPPPMVTYPHNREPYDYSPSDGTELLGHSHGDQTYNSLGFETGCGNNLHIQSDRSARNNMEEEDDLSTKASQSKAFGRDLVSPSQLSVTEGSIRDFSASNTNEFIHSKRLPHKNTDISMQQLKEKFSLTNSNTCNSHVLNRNEYIPIHHQKTSSWHGGFMPFFDPSSPNANTFVPTQFPKEGYSLTEGSINSFGANALMPTQFSKEGYSLTEGNINSYGANAFMPTQFPKERYSLTEGNINSYGANAFMPTQFPKEGYSSTAGNSNSYGANTNTFMPFKLPQKRYSVTDININLYGGPNANAFMSNQLPKKRYSLTEGNINSYGPNANVFMPTQFPKEGYCLTEGNMSSYGTNVNTFEPTQFPKEGYNLSVGNISSYGPNAFMPTQLPKEGYSLTERNISSCGPNANTFLPIQLPKEGYNLTEGNSNSYDPNDYTYMPTKLPKEGYILTEGNVLGLPVVTQNTLTETAAMGDSRCKTDLETDADQAKNFQGQLESCHENVPDLCANSKYDSSPLPGAFVIENGCCDTEDRSEDDNSDHLKEEQGDQLSSAVKHHQKTDSDKTFQPGLVFKNHIKSRYRFGQNLNLLRKPLHFPTFLPKVASCLVSRFKGSDSLHWRKDCKPHDPLQSPRSSLDSPKRKIGTDVKDDGQLSLTPIAKKIVTERSSQQGTPGRWKNWKFSPSHRSPPEEPSNSAEKQSQWTQEFISKSKTYKNTFIDSHCHIDFLYSRLNIVNTPFKKFREEHADYFPANYEGCLAVFCNPKTFSAEKSQNNIVNLLSDEEGVWFSFGCHPKNASEFTDSHEIGLREILTHPKVVSIGEIGLDYSGNFIQNAEVQKKVFKRQLLIGLEMNLPLVIHCRDADDDCLEILQQLVPRDYKIHAHCFSRNMEVAVRWLAAFPNLFIGLTPLITYKSALDAVNTASFIPLDRLLLETDAPYFVPRIKQRIDAKFSFPGFALLTAEKVAEIKGLPVDLILKACRENTKKMYGI